MISMMLVAVGVVAAALTLRRTAGNPGAKAVVFAVVVGSVYVHVGGWGTTTAACLALAAVVVLRAVREAPLPATTTLWALGTVTIMAVVAAVDPLTDLKVLVPFGACVAAIPLLMASEPVVDLATLLSMVLRGSAVVAAVGAVDQFVLRNALLQAFQGRTPPPIYFGSVHIERYSGFFDQPNIAAMYFAPVVVVGIVARLRRSSPAGVDALALATVVVALGATLSRASIASALFALTIAAILRPGESVGRRALPVLWLVLATTGAYLFSAVVRELISSVGSSRYQSNAARELIYRGAVEALKQRPWEGYGAGSLAHVLPLFVPQSVPGIPTPLQDGHDLFLTLSLWFGIPVAVIMFAPLVVASWRVASWRPEVSAVGAGCLAIMLNTLVDSPLTSSPHWLLYAFLVSAALFSRPAEAGVAAAGAANWPTQRTTIWAPHATGWGS